MIPRNARRNKPLAPDQIFSAGYRDGMNGRAPHPEFQNHSHYLKGYAEGCRSMSDTPTFVPFFQSSSLTEALESIQLWERDQERFGFGKVALSYHSGYWTVLVTQDLHDVALPF